MSKYEATLNIKMPGNVKHNVDYNIRLNQEDCTTIELKKVSDEHWPGGGILLPYGGPYEGYNAFSFQLYNGYTAQKYDTKVGTCECDLETGMCAANYWPEVEAGLR